MITWLEIVALAMLPLFLEPAKVRKIAERGSMAPDVEWSSHVASSRVSLTLKTGLLLSKQRDSSLEISHALLPKAVLKLREMIVRIKGRCLGSCYQAQRFPKQCVYAALVERLCCQGNIQQVYRRLIPFHSTISWDLMMTFWPDVAQNVMSLTVMDRKPQK